MNANTFDTHAAVKVLREAGADEAMAEAIVNTASAAAGAGHDDLATKAEFAAVRAEIAIIRRKTGLLAAFMFAIGLRVFGIL